MIASHLDRYVIGREQNVVRVNFVREPEPPTPPFPGAAALRFCAWPPPDNVVSTGIKAEAAR
jgi:hypothetical protein